METAPNWPEVPEGNLSSGGRGLWQGGPRAASIKQNHVRAHEPAQPPLEAFAWEKLSVPLSLRGIKSGVLVPSAYSDPVAQSSQGRRPRGHVVGGDSLEWHLDAAPHPAPLLSSGSGAAVGSRLCAQSPETRD